MSQPPQLTHGSLFAGIGGFDAGFRDSGMRVVWQVEREPFCKAILRTRFPEAELFNDVRECGKHNLGAVDVLTAGFPCQDLSVAGKRAGLGGSRSGLFWEVVRILGELRPAWFVLENVPGLFSSAEGRDFAVVLESLDELGYGLAWRVLDSQFFGVAQRRRRVFIVGSFGRPCPAEVLFESEGSEGDFTEGGETGTGVADETCYRVTPTLSSEGDAHRGFRDDGGLVAYGICGDPTDKIGYDIQPTLRGRETGGGFQQCVAYTLPSEHRGIGNGHNTNYIPTARLAPALTQRDYKGTRCDVEEPAFAIRLAQTSSNGWGISEDGRTHTLDGTGGDTVLASLSGLGSGGPDDNDGQAGRIVSAPSDSHRVRDFAGLPLGLDSARYRALGNAVTAKVAYWIGRRIIECERRG